MSEARDEAERVVKRYADECMGTQAAASDRHRARDEGRHEWGERCREMRDRHAAAAKEQREALVAALAAAIEVDAELSSERWVDDPVTAEERTHRAGRKLHSALGEVRAGKETG